MPNIKSAKKKQRKDLNKTKQNDKYRRSIKSMFKDMKKGKVAKVTQKKLNSIIDKASKRKIIHKNKAARLKSRVSRFLKLKKKSWNIKLTYCYQKKKTG